MRVDFCRWTAAASGLRYAALRYFNACGGESTAFNLGSGAGFSVREVIEEARRVTGHAIPVTEDVRRSGDPARLVASSEKAQRVLGWTPRYSALSTILQTAWNWHSSHPDGF